jgi:serine/arginine repetitive matrix protein 2
MWGRITGKSDAGSNDGRKKRTSDSTRSKRDRDADGRSVVSYPSTRKPSTRSTAPSSIASFATAFDDPSRARATDDLYEDPRDERHAVHSREDRPLSYAESTPSTPRRDRSRSRDRDTTPRKRSASGKSKANTDSHDDRKDERMSKGSRSERTRSTRSDRSGSVSYRGDIVESPREPTRSFSGQITTGGFSQFPGQTGAPMMSGALPPPNQQPYGGMSSHVQAQFPGQDPVQYTSSAMPGGRPFGAAADFYNDQGESVHQQPGVRPQPPSVIIGQDTPHLVAAAAQPNPVADTGSGAAADFYGGSWNAPSSKPSRPSTMPGAFDDDDIAPQKPPRPSSKPSKPTKVGSTATLAGGAALGHVMGHSSSNSQQSNFYDSSTNHHSTSYTNVHSGPATPMYHQGANPSNTATDGSSHIPTYSQAMEGAPPMKPPRPGKPEKHSSGSNAGLYAAGAAGLAAWGLHEHNFHSTSYEHNHNHNHNHTHNHSSTTPGAFPGNNQYGANSSPNAYISGGMAQRHQHTGPVSRFVDWWKDYEDIQKMEEYTEYIGVCKGCFDPRSSVMDAPRKHHYGRRRSSEYVRPSGGIEKQSRYNLKEKKSHSSFSSGDERRKRHSSNTAGWVAAGLGGIGLAKVGKAVLGTGRTDFDDTYSIKSGRHTHKVDHSSRSRSRDRKSYAYGRSDINHRSHSRDRLSQMSVGVTNDRKDYKFIRRHSRSSSSSSSRDGKHGHGKVIGVGLAAAALGSAMSMKRRSRSRSPKKATFVHQRRDSSDDERRRRRSQQLRRKSSRSSASGASVIDISQDHPSQGGFLGGFFAAPAPKLKRVKSVTSSHKKKKKTGFFNFGNGSSSSSDSDMAFGTGYVKKKRRASPKRRNSDARLKASLVGLGATATAIAAAKAARSSGRRQSEVIAVKEHRNRPKLANSSRPGSRYGDDEWEDLPDDDDSDSSSNLGLVYGEHDWGKRKSQESLASNGSGTNKWSWRWGGIGKKKRRSSDNLYDSIANTALIGPAASAATGAIAGAALGSRLGRHDSESSSAHTLQIVHPVASNDPTMVDARRTSSIATPQPMITSGPGALSLQQPQPMHQVPGAIYSTPAPSKPSYAAPFGPPVFSQVSGPSPYPTQVQSQNVFVQMPQQSGPPSLPRRANSSPIQTTSWKRDAAIGLVGTATAAAIVAAKGRDRAGSTSSSVRFDLTEGNAAKDERERRKQRARQDEEDRIRREQQKRDEDTRRDEDDRRRREQQRRDDEERRLDEERRQDQLRRDESIRLEEDRRRLELMRQQEEARKFMEADRLAKIEAGRLAEERRQQQDAVRAAEDRDRQERNARAEAQRRLALEAEAEQMRRKLRDTERRDAERVEASRREAEIRQDLEQRQREREWQERTDRYDSNRVPAKLEQQRTGGSSSSVATDVRRKEKELEDRERDLVQPADSWKSTAASAMAAGAAAAITTAAISSYKDNAKSKEREEREDRDRERNRRRDFSSTAKDMEPRNVTSVRPVEPSSIKTNDPASIKTNKSSSVKGIQPSAVRNPEPTQTGTSGNTRVKTFEPSSVVTWTPSNIQQDYADEDIFDPSLFKKKSAPQTAHAVLEDWEERYNQPAVSQAEFFAPKELLANDNLPKVRPVDPNEGATNLHTFEAHEDVGPAQPMVPPYPASYSFTATRDGRPSMPQPMPVPALNLILPTPPGSRTPSVRGVSLPPSPNIEPVAEPKEMPKRDEANRARSRVSWGENQFHHFEVQTPDSHREQFVSDSDLKKQEKKYTHDEIVIERDSPKSGQQTTTYQPYRPKPETAAPAPPEIAPSTQYVRDEKASDWDNIVEASSKKISKKDKKKAQDAAETATISANTQSPLRDDEHQSPRYNASVVSNPFSDSHFAPSTIAPSTVMGRSTEGPGFVEGEVIDEPSSMHMPGSFEETPATEKTNSQMEAEWAASTKKDSNGKGKSRSTDDVVVAQSVPKRAESAPVRQPEPVKEIASEPEAKASKKDKKKKSKAAKRVSVDSWEGSDVSPLTSPTVERDIRDIEPPRAPESNRGMAESNNTTQPTDRTTSTGVAAAMAGGFAALVDASKKQDQDRMAADLEHARHSNANSRTDEDRDMSRSIPSMVFGEEDLVDAKAPKRKKAQRHSSGRFSPTIGSPLRTETKYEDYMGAASPPAFNAYPPIQGPKEQSTSAFTAAPEPTMNRNVYDSGYYAPDEPPRRDIPERDSDEFFSAGSEERERARANARETDRKGVSPPSHVRTKSNDDVVRSVAASQDRYDDAARVIAAPQDRYDDSLPAVGSSTSKVEEDPDHEERRRERREVTSEEREQSRDRDYDVNDGGERKRRHRRRHTDEAADDWENQSTISEARSETNGERRRKHKRRDGSTDSAARTRSSAVSEIGDLYDDDRKSSSRRSKRGDDDDNASVISSSSRHDDDRSSKKEKEKKSGGFLSMFSKSRENLAEPPGKSSKPKDDDDDEGKRRRRKHRSDRGSTFGSDDDDDARSTISSSSRREKRSSRSERGDSERRDSNDEKVHRSSAR